jgi:tetratricopeptide (TPR) repeat protein
MNEALMRQAAGLQQIGRFEEAAQCYRHILRANPRHFEALFSLGMICLQTEQFEEGQRILADALKLNPRFGEGWCARGIARLRCIYQSDNARD